MDESVSVWNFSGAELEQNELLCSSGQDASSQDPKLKSQAVPDHPRRDAKTGVNAVSPGNSMPAESESPPQQAGASTQKAVPNEDPSSRNSQEADHLSNDNHWASGQTPAPSQSTSDQNDLHSGKQQVGSSTEASERKQANNREHQRRWRLRQKARTAPSTWRCSIDTHLVLGYCA